MHVLVVNLCLHLHMLQKESIVEIKYAMRYDNDDSSPDNATTAPDTQTGNCVDPQSVYFNVPEISTITIYLYPCAIEFTMICALFFYKMYIRVGRM